MVEPLLPLELAIAKRASISLSPSRLRAFSYTLAHLYLLKIFGVLCCVCVGVGFSSEVLLCLLVP